MQHPQANHYSYQIKSMGSISLTIFLVCIIINDKKWKKDHAMFRICYSTPRYRIWSFSQFFILFSWTRQNDEKNLAPCSKWQLGWGLVPFSAAQPTIQRATQLLLLVENQVSPEHPNPFFPGPPWLGVLSSFLPMGA